MWRALANLCLVLASLACCGAALEISMRRVLPQPPLPTGSEALPRVAHRPHYEPSLFARNVMARSAHTVEAWTGATYPIDERGYRGAGFSLGKPAGIVRIVVYGGSAAFDVARSGDDDWPSHAGRLLRARGHPVEVINAAVPGHASFDSLGRFLAEGQRLDPDVVVLYHGWNDLKYFGDPRPLLQIYRPYRPEEDPLARPRGPLDAELAARSHFYRLLRRRFVAWSRRDETEGQRPHAELRDAFEPRQVAQFALVVATFVDLVRNAGGLPVLMTQARLPSATSPAEVRERVRYDHVGLRHDALVEAYAAADAAILRVARHKRVPLIDARAALGHDARYFLDHVHLTPEGSDALAEQMASGISGVLEESRSPSVARHARAPSGGAAREVP